MVEFKMMFVSETAYNEIKKKFEEAGDREHPMAFQESEQFAVVWIPALDMTGAALSASKGGFWPKVRKDDRKIERDGMTYSYAIMNVSEACYNEIKARMEAAGCQHAINDGELDMCGIALAKEK
jgi:hypothetical protein